MAASVQEATLRDQIATTRPDQGEQREELLLALVRLRESFADFEGGISLLETALVTDPLRPALLHELAHLRRRVGDDEGARRAEALAKAASGPP